MRILNSICYYCGAIATTTEHAPPKCIFPEEKDIGNLDYRNNLITVPSCEKHNLKKSEDDEYFFFIVIGGAKKNKIGSILFKTKMMRIVNRTPKKIADYLNNMQIVPIMNKTSGLIENKIAITIDINKLNNVLVSTTKALYFYQFSSVAKNTPNVLYNGCVFPTDKSHLNPLLSQIEVLADALFNEEQWIGNNPEIFKYKVKKIGKSKYWYLLYFFDLSEYITELEIS